MGQMLSRLWDWQGEEKSGKARETRCHKAVAGGNQGLGPDYETDNTGGRMSQELRELLKSPFRYFDFEICDADGPVSNKIETGQVEFMRFSAAAMNEKWEREFGEPLCWVLIEWKPFDNRLAVICPKCDSPFEYHAIEFSNFCPHCGQKLKPPENTDVS